MVAMRTRQLKLHIRISISFVLLHVNYFLFECEKFSKKYTPGNAHVELTANVINTKIDDNFIFPQINLHTEIMKIFTEI